MLHFYPKANEVNSIASSGQTGKTFRSTVSMKLYHGHIFSSVMNTT
jgi:hypothetical protein